MELSRYCFKFSLFGNKVQKYHEKGIGIVIEKEQQVVCIYGTDDKHQSIYCAIPLCHPKHLKGLEYMVRFEDNDLATIAVGDIKVVIHFAHHTCSNNKGIRCYGSRAWGQDVSVEWNNNFLTYFEN